MSEQSARYGVTPVPDPIFANPRLARIYDELDADRGDLDHYVALVEELGAASVLDVGCGTGTFACLLAAKGLEVTGVDPAEASLEVARQKAAADLVRWHLGDATMLPSLDVDLATMTGNAAQVFLEDRDWLATLSGIRNALRPSGRLVFEVRDPARRGWKEWNREDSFSRVEIAGVGVVESWVELTDVSLPMVSFRWTYAFENDGAVLTSDSTLRFREKDEVEASLKDSGFTVLDVRDAPDRPGKELVFVAGPLASTLYDSILQ
jgi:SAM-dependent methyltransferase